MTVTWSFVPTGYQYHEEVGMAVTCHWISHPFVYMMMMAGQVYVCCYKKQGKVNAALLAQPRSANFPPPAT